MVRLLALWNQPNCVSPEYSLDSCTALGTPFEQVWKKDGQGALQLLAPLISGKGKIILDMSNPFLSRPDGYGAGMPDGFKGPAAGIAYHKEQLNDPSVKWVGSYKHIMWTLILPTGKNHPFLLSLFALN